MSPFSLSRISRNSLNWSSIISWQFHNKYSVSCTSVYIYLYEIVDFFQTLLLEKSKGSALKKELTYLRDVAEDGKLAREEANELRAKFERMRSVEKILTGDNLSP